MLTYQTAVDLGIRHALHGSPAAELSETMLLNMAGQHLISMRRWSWCDREPTPVDLVANQPFVTMPDGCAEIVGAVPNGNLNMRELRGIDMTPAGLVFWLAPTFTNPGDPGSLTGRGQQLALQVYPVPTSTSPGAILVEWRAGWIEVKSDASEQQILPLPADGSCDTLYLTLLRAFAKGFEEDNTRRLEVELEAIERGGVFNAAVRLDGRRASYRGQLRNGLLDVANRGRFRGPLQYLSEPVTGYQAT
jgi:hypothetical protein